MKTYLFYDVETSGLNPAFDQILTFACIRTDLLLNEISRSTITIQLRKDIVPSPGAFLTHGLTMAELSTGLKEYHAARKIHAEFNTPGTISIGYNSLGFDDDFLRFLFYRNLLDPYTHQFHQGCSRMDMLPIATIFKVFHPNGLSWPTTGDGRPSLKLDLIAAENRFVTSGRAHEAMSDVEALVALAKRFYVHTDIWAYCLEFFDKKQDEARFRSLKKKIEINGENFVAALLVSPVFGPEVNYLSPAICIGSSIPYKNQTLWLRLDTEDILGMNENLPLEKTYVMRKRFGDALIVLPPLDRFHGRVSSAASEMSRINVEKIRNHPDRFSAFVQYHCAYAYPYIPKMDIDAALYQDGFFTRAEKAQSEQFHNAPDAEKYLAMEKISSPRIQRLAERILARNFDDHPAAGKNDSAACLRMEALKTDNDNREAIIGFRNDQKLTCGDALIQLDKLKEALASPDAEQLKMLEWLRQYLTNGLQLSSADPL